MNTPVITLGRRLNMAREAAHISVADMADTLDVTRQTLSRYEHDAGPVPPAVLYAYVSLCEVPMSWLLGHSDIEQEKVAWRGLGQLRLWVHGPRVA